MSSRIGIFSISLSPLPQPGQKHQLGQCCGARGRFGGRNPAKNPLNRFALVAEPHRYRNYIVLQTLAREQRRIRSGKR
jgi:hypothetical protein